MFHISRHVSFSQNHLERLCRHPIDRYCSENVMTFVDVVRRYTIFICIAYQKVYFAINISVEHHDSKEKLKRPDKNLDVESISIFLHCTL